MKLPHIFIFSEVIKFGVQIVKLLETKQKYELSELKHTLRTILLWRDFLIKSFSEKRKENDC